MIPKLSGREKVQAHVIANHVNEIIEIITKLEIEIKMLKNEIEVLKKFKEETIERKSLK